MQWLPEESKIIQLIIDQIHFQLLDGRPGDS